MEKLKPGRHTLTLKQVKELYKKGIITFYANNRGTGKVSKKTVASVVASLDTRVLGSIPLAQFTGSDTAELLDWHSRMTGIIEREIEGLNTAAEDEYQVVLDVHKVKNSYEKMRLYEKFNVQSAHTSANRLDSSDYLFGYTLGVVLQRAGVSPADPYYYRFRDQLANTVYAYAHEQTMEWAATFNQRNKAKKDFTTLVDGSAAGYIYNLKEGDIDLLAESVAYYIETIESFKERAANDNSNIQEVKKQVNAIIKSKSFAGLLTSDFVRDKKRFSRIKPKTLGHRLYKHIMRAAPKIKYLTTGNVHDMNERCDELQRLLTA